MYENIRNTATGQEDYTIAIKQINFTVNLDRAGNKTVFFV